MKDRTPVGRRWTEEDKIFAFDVQTESSSLQIFIHLLSIAINLDIKISFLSRIPFDIGIKELLEPLKIKSDEMDELNRYCSLVFDEISLSKDYHYRST